MRFLRSAFLALGAALALAGCGDRSAPAAAPAIAVDTEVAVISTTEGDMTIAFRSDKAPKTVENFKKLAKAGFYNGTAFHRVMKGFMIQGGDPLTKNPDQMAAWGTGNPGYTIKAEFNDLSHKRGAVSMARGGHPDSAGCQFFICHGNPAFLDGKYTTFGLLVKGDEVLEKIATAPVATSPSGESSRPLKPVVVKSITFAPQAAAY